MSQEDREQDFGYDGPKGTYKLPIGEDGKYLFQIFIEKLKKTKKNYGIYVTCYIMTSEENYIDTVSFFEKMQ